MDKFLKNSRLIKRRSLAKEICDQGRVEVNGNTAKAGSDVKPGDEITIYYSQKSVTVEVKELLDSTKKEDAARMYAVKEEKIVRDE